MLNLLTRSSSLLTGIYQTNSSYCNDHQGWVKTVNFFTSRQGLYAREWTYWSYSARENALFLFISTFQLRSLHQTC